MQDTTENTERVGRLVQSHRQFLAFLERQLPSREAAEDVLQTALVKSLERADQLVDDERLTAWFYRVLRNGVTDWYRRRAAFSKTQDGNAQEPTSPTLLVDDVSALCRCFEPLLGDLKTEYSAAIIAVDLQERSLQDFALSEGITPQNARVRLHRGRKALRARLLKACGTCATHGCLDCTCSGPAPCSANSTN